MALTEPEVREAMRTAIQGMIVELDSGALVVDDRGAKMEYVAQLGPEEPQAFAVAFLFLSDDEAAQAELYRRISKYLALGLPEMDED